MIKKRVALPMEVARNAELAPAEISVYIPGSGIGKEVKGLERSGSGMVETSQSVKIVPTRRSNKKLH